MKKIFMQPMVEVEKMMSTSILCSSVGVSDEPFNPGPGYQPGDDEKPGLLDF